MRLPDKDFQVRIGPVNYRVFYNEKEMAANQQFGEHRGDYQEILLDPRIPDAGHLSTTFIHEVLHAIFALSGLNYAMFEEKREVSEEEIVRTLSPWLTLFLTDNAFLFSLQKGPEYGKSE